MGLFDFAANIGKKLFGNAEDSDAGDKIVAEIEKDNPGVSDLHVSVRDGVAHVKGTAADQAAWEKAVLLAGNIEGIKEVNADELEVTGGSAADAIAAATSGNYYEIQKGDTLWKIAADNLGNGARYTEIFEANREVIKDPDLIYPGQKIRIPA
ncbi:peptidoglycan-binding protein LysM [Gammaproteobacteria bacterium]|nr:peptidoglycan-binding protein LysM [Gammaproteobacteria bacterium]